MPLIYCRVRQSSQSVPNIFLNSTLGHIGVIASTHIYGDGEFNFGVWCPRGPLGPLLFSLVLHILVSEIATELGCAHLLYHAWYLDDGYVAGPNTEVRRVLTILEEKGRSLGLHVNIAKCEVICCSDLSLFILLMKQSHQPNIGILGIPIGDLDFCTTFISHKHCLAKQLMQQIEEVGALDPQVALLLLCTCSGFCKLGHLARATLSVKALELFDLDVRDCLSQSTLVDMTDVSWNQAQLSLNRGGLGLRSLMLQLLILPPFVHLAMATCRLPTSPMLWRCSMNV